MDIGNDWRISLIRQHTRFMLDERPINWKDRVFISWLADDGFMLERYSEADEELLQAPPQCVGEIEFEEDLESSDATDGGTLS